jgi:hypothetical protein
MNVYEFSERLAWSQGVSADEAWEVFYRRLWPDLSAITAVTKNGHMQGMGIDKRISLPNGKQITVDEKVRKGDYNDFLVETHSVWWERFDDSRNKVGWTLDEDKHCDFVAYAVPEAGYIRLLPAELMRLACRRNLDRWNDLAERQRDGFRVVVANSKRTMDDGRIITWKTRNIVVPWPVYEAAERAEKIVAARGDGAFGPLLPAPHDRQIDLPLALAPQKTG